MSELPPAQFRKTKAGKWAVMAPVASLEAALAADGKVEVLKKSGDWSKFTVASLGKAFDVDGVQMCYGYGPDDSDDANSSTGRQEQKPGSGPDRSSAPRRRAQNTNYQAPTGDPSEPLPEYQGGAEDEWDGGF